MRVAGYVRVSTQEQAEEGYSIPEQSDRIEKYCEAKGWDLIRIYTDGGYSGAKMDRPALQELIADISKYEMVLVYKLDRLSRSQKDTIYLIEDVFKKNDVDFSSMQENFDTSTPIGIAMIGIISVFAQLEREQIKERMMMGKTGKAKNGYWPSSHAPIGYRYVPKIGLEVNPEEAEQVREIYGLFLAGVTRRQIAIRLGNKYSNRAYYRPCVIRQILTNPVYYGKMRWKGEVLDGRHESIISEQEYLQAQRILKRSATTNAGRADHLLTGIVYCGVCGSRMTYQSTVKPSRKKYAYYMCNRRHDLVGKMSCKGRNINAEVIEKAVVDQVMKLRFSDIKAPAPIDNSKKIEKIDRQIEKAMQLYTVDDISIEKVKEMISSLSAKRSALQEEERASERVEAPRIDLKDVRAVLQGDDQKAKIRVINALVDKVLVQENGIEICFTFK